MPWCGLCRSVFLCVCVVPLCGYRIECKEWYALCLECETDVLTRELREHGGERDVGRDRRSASSERGDQNGNVDSGGDTREKHLPTDVLEERHVTIVVTRSETDEELRRDGMRRMHTDTPPSKPTLRVSLPPEPPFPFPFASLTALGRICSFKSVNVKPGGVYVDILSGITPRQ